MATQDSGEVEHNRMTGALQEKDGVLSAILKNIPAVVYLMSPDSHFLHINRRFEELFDLKNEEVRGKSVYEVFPREVATAFESNNREVIEKRSPIEFEEIVPHPDGLHTYTSIKAPFLDAAGEPYGVIGISTDITERKRAEEERAHLMAELQRRADELARANRLKDEFLATLSHELRTPLTAVLGWARMMTEDKLDEATRAHGLRVIKSNAEAQQHLIEEILDVSRIITGKLRIELVPIELIPVVEAAVEAVRPAAQAKAIQIRTAFDPEANFVSGDADRLQQVVWNLLSNAVKFTPKGGRVEVQLERVDAQSRLVVSDTGQGIAPEFLPHVFERFRQADQSAARLHSGLGLGLALVRHLVELHGGTVSARSEGKQKGATFVVELPAITPKSEDPMLSRAQTANDALLNNFAALRGVRVLVVDDETHMRELLCVMLRQYGMEVLTARSADEGLSLLERARPDLLIADIGMPGEDGYALIKKIRALPLEQGGGIPAIALTAYTGASHRERALAAGYQEHVPKPVEPTELAAIMLNLIKPRKSA